MKSSNNAGFSTVEFAIIIFVVLLVSGVILYAGIAGSSNETRARAALSHLKIMANLLENQKRILGEYPLTLAAMRNKSSYLTPGGNRAGYTTPAELRLPWAGPYLKNYVPYEDQNYLPDIVYKIDLAEIYPEMEGELGYLFEAPKVLAYTLTNENSPSGEEDFDDFARILVKKCNNTDQIVIPPRLQNYSHSYVTGSPAAPCGYATYRGKIEYVSYFITRYT